MEIIIVLLVVSVAANVFLLCQWNQELEDHARTLTMSTAVIKDLNERIKELREELKGGELNDEETSN